eukprot:TRINITY_DN8489_c0_g1_i1.p1 TRINITY_DN8489_c0_g1~~TRINITY_DN8489_c0_g1_i1.p1  ORF type:complete len:521 (+),score=83.78 TRINITY_DN8489_c0_g1_i1:87-1649(+)
MGEENRQLTDLSLCNHEMANEQSTPTVIHLNSGYSAGDGRKEFLSENRSDLDQSLQIKYTAIQTTSNSYKAPWRTILHTLFVIYVDSFASSLLALNFVFIQFVVLIIFPMSDGLENWFLYSYGIVGAFIQYITIFCGLCMCFSFEKRDYILWKLMLPFLVLHIVLFSIRYWNNLEFLRPVYYLTFALYYYAITKSFEEIKSPQSIKEVASLMEIFTDGTPKALRQGCLIFILFYGFFVFVFYPAFESASFTMKLILRSVLYPMLFGSLNGLQNHFISNKSPHMTEKRLYQANFLNCLFVFIGRLMLTNVGSNQQNLTIVVLTAAFELSSRLSYPLRRRFFVWLLEKWSLAFDFVASRFRTRVGNFDWTTSLQQPVPIPESVQQSSLNDLSASSCIGQEKIAHSSIAKHNNFRAHQVALDMRVEVSAICVVPFLLYFVNPIRDCYSVPVVMGVDEALSQVFVQLPIAFLTDFLSLSYEVYVSGLNFEIQWDWRFVRQITSTLYLVTACYLSVSAFLKECEN